MTTPVSDLESFQHSTKAIKYDSDVTEEVVRKKERMKGGLVERGLYYRFNKRFNYNIRPTSYSTFQFHTRGVINTSPIPVASSVHVDDSIMVRGRVMLNEVKGVKLSREVGEII